MTARPQIMPNDNFFDDIIAANVYMQLSSVLIQFLVRKIAVRRHPML